MASRSGKLALLLTSLAVTLSLVACGTTATPTTLPSTATPTLSPSVVPTTAAPTKAVATVTAVPATPTAGPTTGGKVMVGTTTEPTTLDPALSNMNATYEVMSLIGDALISRDPFTGQYVPWLAESWSFSDDGLTGTFKLRKDVKWHDGTPFTAKDYEFTFNRALDPKTESSGTGPSLASMKDAKAVDDYTLEIHMSTPFFPILINLAMPGTASPLPQAWIEKNGAEKYGRSPIGEGMYKFVSWETGTRITLQRNPDYKWGPKWVTGPFIDTIEFRYIPDDSTLMAGLEAGEIDFVGLQPTGVSRFEANPNVTLYASVPGGNSGFVLLNQSFPLLQDLNVRKALAMAVDRKPIIQAVYNGDATEAYGPLNYTTGGYDPIQETYGYKLDLAGAKAALQSAGYTVGSDGKAVKDGQPLRFTLNTAAGVDTFVKLAQILQAQWKAIGVEVDIQQLDPSTGIADINAGKYEAATLGFGYADFDVIPLLFLSTASGGAGLFQVTDPKWDELQLATRSTLDPAKRQDACNAAAKYMMQNVYMISFAAALQHSAVASRIKGYVYSQVTGDAWIYNAYIAK